MKTFLPYEARAKLCSNPTARRLLSLMAQKKTNLAVSLDVTRKEDLLQLADLLGPEIVVLKTHIDILEDFDVNLGDHLMQLAHKHEFLIFEDRKFADIGHTVQLQYGKGIYQIANWADITNAHALPGPGIIEGLKEVGLEKGRGLLLLAQMSSQGNLLDQNYTQKTIALAQAHRDFVIGFISQQCLVDDPTLIHFTPGIHYDSQGDHLGQQYTTPKVAIVDHGTDIIIVGRGIYNANDPLAIAREYRKMGWEAYQALSSF